MANQQLMAGGGGRLGTGLAKFHMNLSEGSSAWRINWISQLN